ncbi:MAG: nucleotidyl transferase AbiEii/AbiGii toxin family protein [Deltaproteobacteria bacterium]|nr:nucleotidyl transferase AbiEii/AbiGii toxin family protein [Deltaproteobacteria bacterium]
MARRVTRAQIGALDRLSALLPRGYYLGGGVAVAAHLSHRRSMDLDLFGTEDPRRIQRRLEGEPGVVIIDRAPGTLHIQIDGIPASLLQYDYSLLAPLTSVQGIAVPVASLDDLAAMKLSAIGDRGVARDFWDLHAIIESTGKPLDHHLEAFKRKYPKVDVGHIVRGLVYFADAEEGPRPRGLEPDTWARIRSDFERWVRALK